MEEADRITFITPDGGAEERVHATVYVFSNGKLHGAKLLESVVPDWEQTGMEIVVAKADGSVVTAFTVEEMSMAVEEPEPGPKNSGLYRVYRGQSTV